jgi:hypothetical protein
MSTLATSFGDDACVESFGARVCSDTASTSKNVAAAWLTQVLMSRPNLEQVVGCSSSKTSESTSIVAATPTVVSLPTTTSMEIVDVVEAWSMSENEFDVLLQYLTS